MTGTNTGTSDWTGKFEPAFETAGTMGPLGSASIIHLYSMLAFSLCRSATDAMDIPGLRCSSSDLI